jgi:transcription factor C subunit 6
VPRKSYTTDAFDGIEHLIADHDGVDQRATSPANVENGDAATVNDVGDDDEKYEDEGYDDDDDVEFEADEAEPIEEEEEEDGDGFDEDEAISDVEEEGRVRSRAVVKKKQPNKRPQPNEPGYTSPSRKARPRVPRHPNQQVSKASDLTLYNRGYPSGLTQTPAKGIRRLYFFGPTEKTLEISLLARRKYPDGPCLPSRKADAQGLGGFIVCDDWKREVKAARQNWAWYDEGGGAEMFNQGQVTRELCEAETQKYLQANSSFSERKFVAGPIDAMAVYTLQIGETMPLTVPFEEGQEQPNIPKDYKRGFILNLGERVQCVEWAPNQTGSRQYLAVCALPEHPEDNPRNPAVHGPRSFRPQPRYKSAIQVWEFVADKQQSIDTAVPPRRRITLCMAHGDVKVLKWCPVPCNAKDRMGLLACITGDGYLRVFSVPQHPENDETNSNILLEQAAFAVSAPNTVYTCLDWLSSSRLAAGCANGCMAIWDLQSVLIKKSNISPSSPNTTPPPPRPIAYLSISTTYILSVTSCYPTQPSILAISSMTGYVTLLDLRPRLSSLTNPNLPLPMPPLLGRSALSSRTRIGVHPVIYSPLLRSNLNADENGNLRAMPLRMHHVFCGVARERASALALAGSFFHPFVLMGTVAGSATCTNPTGRTVGGGKVEIWQGRWFTHEWQRNRGGSGGDGNDGGGNPEGEGEVDGDEKGLARIVEGYKPESVLLSRNTDPANIHDDIVFATIYEPRAAITALSWNCNLHVAGWAAAGMADGLLKVEDIAVPSSGGKKKRK